MAKKIVDEEEDLGGRGIYLPTLVDEPKPKEAEPAEEPARDSEAEEAPVASEREPIGVVRFLAFNPKRVIRIPYYEGEDPVEIERQYRG